MSVGLRSRGFQTGLLILLSACAALTLAQPEGEAVVEVLRRGKPPFPVRFTPEELRAARSNPALVRDKLIREFGREAECPEPRNIADGVWACRNGLVVRTRHEDLKRALAKLYR